MSKDETLYVRGFVVIKEKSPQSEWKTSPLDEISGTLTLINNERGKFLRYIPLGLEDTIHEDWALINGGHSIVSFKNDSDAVSIAQSPLLKYRYIINLYEIRSIRRHHMSHGVAHIVFIMKDGTTLPAFHFNMGGSKELLQIIAQSLQLEKSKQDQRLYIVKDDSNQSAATAPTSIFDQMNLFDGPNDLSKRFKTNDARRTAVERLSKVTHFIKDTLLGQNEFIESNETIESSTTPQLTALMESLTSESRESDNDGFEVIYKVDFKNSPEVSRGQPLTMQEWQSSFDKDGRLIDIEKIKERIFRGGLESNQLRQEVWKFLLNYYPWDSTRDQRVELNKQRQNDYSTMKLQWKSVTEQQKLQNSMFRERKSLIEKDVARTDRGHEYFQGDGNPHLVVLHDILMTYNMYNFDLGYVQGMNDLLSPILVIMENEVDSFWCFVGLMNRMEQNFHMDQAHIKTQLTNLYTLLQFIDADLAKYLVDHNANNMYFFFRWMLIGFKREFPFDDVMYLWEVLWTDYLCKNFDLLICLSILISQKTTIIESSFGCTEILKFFNDLSCNLDLDTCLLSAEKLYIQLTSHRDIPNTICRLLGLSRQRNVPTNSNVQDSSFPRKIYTEQPRGTMNLDNSYFRQESEASFINPRH